jgi:hypothetical protein
MLPDDRYQTQLAQTKASLLAWSRFVRDVATVTVDDTGATWAFGLVPRTAGACAAALVLERDRQVYGLALAGESYEDLPVTSFDAFLPLLEAVAAGRVIERRHYGVTTHRPAAIEMRVGPAAAPLFRGTRRLDGAEPGAPLADHAAEDRHFLPYRRGR